MKKWIIIAVLVLVVLAGYWIFNATSEPARQATPAPAPNRYAAAEGKVVALPGWEIRIGAELDARIERLYVKEGDSVRQGQLLAELDSRDIQARLAEAQSELVLSRARLNEVQSGARAEEIRQADARLERARAELALAEKGYHRQKTLAQANLSAIAAQDESETALAAAQARLREAQEEKQLLEKGPKPETVQVARDAVQRAAAAAEYFRQLLRKSRLHAPISGKVIRQFLHQGEIIVPETPLLTLADPQRIRVNAEVDETDLGRFQLGDPAEISSPAYPGQVFRGKVEEIADYVGVREIRPDNPAANLGLKIVQVKIALEETGFLKLGMSVDVKIVPRQTRQSPEK